MTRSVINDTLWPALLVAIGLVLGGVEVTYAAKPSVAVTLRYTEAGVPHVRAHDFRSLGYGEGYAQARDHLCLLADVFVTLRGQRSRYFGADRSYLQGLVETQVGNLHSDVFYGWINQRRVVERARAQRFPRGPSREVRQLVRGYVGGYNRFLRERLAMASGGPSCRRKAWVRPITEVDVYRRAHQLAMGGSGLLALTGIARAQPPSPAATASRTPRRAADRIGGTVRARKLGLALGRQRGEALGSNSMAFGREASADGGGLLLANPHASWRGSELLWQYQLTLPGEFNASGASFLGFPIFLLGHNANVAWGLTVSTARRFALFEVPLVSVSPTRYRVDGRSRAMRADKIVVVVRSPKGQLKTVRRTVWSTRYGPVLAEIAGAALPWTPTTAYSFADAGRGNLRMLNSFLALSRSRTVRGVKRALVRTQGNPVLNTVAADDRGRVLYGDLSVVPHVTDEHARTCSTPLGRVLFSEARIPVLDGSRSGCRLGSDADALAPGIFGPQRLPSLERVDYVTNSNDSHWLVNARTRLTGFPRIIGLESTERTLRTRAGLEMIEELIGSGQRLSVRGLGDLLFSNRNYAGELTAGSVASMCQRLPGGVAPSREGPVAAEAACAALAGWNRRDDLDSRGAILFRRLWSRLVAHETLSWRTPFSDADPVATPRSLDVDTPAVHKALGDAIVDLREAGIPADAPLRGHQVATRGGRRISIHGGPGPHGVFNVITAPWRPSERYLEVVSGSSYNQVVSVAAGRCPRALTLTTYSQSSDAGSPHHADQTRRYSRKRWLPGRFCERDILASPSLRIVRLRERRPAG